MALVRVIGLGYVGLTTALGLAKLGHSVQGIDINPLRVENLSNGILPFFEEGMQELLSEQLVAGAISFHLDNSGLSTNPEFCFICVPTPSAESGDADLRFLNTAIAEFKNSVSPGATLVVKSTVPIGTGAKIASDLELSGYYFASSPEFLREGSAVKDFFSPERVIVGSNDSTIANKVLNLFSQIEAPKVKMSLLAAETTKYAANAYLAVRLSFVNEIARLCEAVGADVNEVSSGLAQDKRIGGHFLSPGPGWGGSCFPKDVRAILHTAAQHKVELLTVAAAAQSNEIAQNRIVSRAVEILGDNVSGRKIAVWGLTYKANTDDTRESPAVNIVRELCKLGASVQGYDPRAVISDIPGLTRVETPLKACDGAELLIVLTEWPEFAQVSAREASSLMETSRILDARNILNSEDWTISSEYFWANGGTTKQTAL